MNLRRFAIHPGVKGGPGEFKGLAKTGAASYFSIRLGSQSARAGKGISRIIVKMSQRMYGHTAR